MTKRIPSYLGLHIIVPGILLLYLFLFLLHPISITSTDLGFYLKKGELLAESGQLIRTNYFTFPNREISVSVDHWGAELIFYSLQQVVGFAGLHLVGLLFVGLPFILLLRLLRMEQVAPIIILVSGVLLIPLLAVDFRITPALFTLFFVVFYVVLLYQYLIGRTDAKLLFILPVLQVVWANTDTYFLLGIAVLLLAIGCLKLAGYFGELVVASRPLYPILAACFIACCFHPDPIQHLLGSFGQLIDYLLVSNETSYNLISRYWYTKSPVLLLQMGVILSLFFCLFLTRSQYRKVSYLFLSGLILLISVYIYHHFQPDFLALLSFPIFSLLINAWWQENKNPISSIFKWHSPIVLLYLLVPLLLLGQLFSPFSEKLGIGIPSDSFAAANFIKENKIEGLFFHNKRASGYLAYTIFPEEQLYILPTNNGSPADFRNNHYFPSLRTPASWETTKLLYNFNAIYFDLEKESIANLKFLGDRLAEQSSWALVYHQPEKTAILLKRSPQNEAIIAQKEIKLEIPN